VLVMTNPWKAGSIGSVFYSLKQLCCFFFNNRDGATKGVLRTPFSSFYVAHLAQPNESSRRRVVAVIKNDWAAPNPKWFKTSTNHPCPEGNGHAHRDTSLCRSFFRQFSSCLIFNCL
jgi:hypothetical protein